MLQWIHSGSMQASKVAGVYVVEELEVVRRRYRGRPMSERMAWAFMEFLSWADPRLDNATKRARLRRYWTDLKADSDPASLLATWLRRRAERLECQAQLGSIEEMLW